jgi:hypothetical protein
VEATTARAEAEGSAMSAGTHAAAVDPVFEAIENCVVHVLETCIDERGFQLPIIIVGVSADGCVFAVRFEHGQTGIETVPLTIHRSGVAFRFPINLMVSDSATSDPAHAVMREVRTKPEFLH